MKPNFQEFSKEWWKNNAVLAETEMAKNGQFDELPYVEYEELYGEIEDEV